MDEEAEILTGSSVDNDEKSEAAAVEEEEIDAGNILERILFTAERM